MILLGLKNSKHHLIDSEEFGELAELMRAPPPIVGNQLSMAKRRDDCGNV